MAVLKRRSSRRRARPFKKKKQIVFKASKEEGWGERIRSFTRKYGVEQIVMPRLSGFSTRSIASWSTGDKPSAPARQKLTELERLFEALAELVEPGSIGGWLRQPNQAFQGSTPLQVIERGESDRLWQMIYQLRSGEPG